MGKRELEVLDEELLDVWAADVSGLLNFDNLEDLNTTLVSLHSCIKSVVNVRGST